MRFSHPRLPLFLSYFDSQVATTRKRVSTVVRLAGLAFERGHQCLLYGDIARAVAFFGVAVAHALTHGLDTLPTLCEVGWDWQGVGGTGREWGEGVL